MAEEPYRYEVSTEYEGEARAVEIDWDIDPDYAYTRIHKSIGVRPKTRRQRHAGLDHISAAKELGQRLFEKILPDPLGAQYVAAAGEAISSGRPLRLRLNTDAAPDLADQPWEFLHQSRGGLEFLSSSQRSQVVRHVGVVHQLPPQPPSETLRIGVVVAQPNDVGLLDVESEWNNLGEAIQWLVDNGSFILEWLPAVWDALADRLLKRQDAVDVLHLIGHGDFDTRTQTGFLLFEDEAGGREEVRSDQVAAVLEAQPPKLVFLNSCHGANTSPTDPYSGMAQSLLGRGVESVVAMQFEITDTAALKFSKSLYKAISEGDRLDAAVAEGRKRVRISGSMDWLIPVLYLQRDPEPLVISTARVDPAKVDGSRVEQRAPARRGDIASVPSGSNSTSGRSLIRGANELRLIIREEIVDR